VFLWGSLQAEKLGLDYDPELRYVGAMFHDVGLLDGLQQGIVEAFSAGIRDKPETTFGPMNADILEATVPGYVRPATTSRTLASRADQGGQT